MLGTLSALLFRRVPLPFTIGLIVVLIAVPSYLAYLDVSIKQRRMHTETNTTLATITSVDFGNHSLANYQYFVKGKTYNSGSSGWGTRVRIREKVILHFNPDNPAQHTLGNFAPFTLKRFLFGFAAIDGAILWLFYLVIIRRKA